MVDEWEQVLSSEALDIAVSKEEERAIAPASPSHLEEDLSLDDVLPPVPPGLMQMANWFRVGFALFVLLSSLLGLSGCGVQASVPWQAASRILPQSVLEQVLMEQTSIPEQEQEDVLQATQAWVVGGDEGKLVMLHYNTAEVCGAMGCLYNGVWLKDDDKASIVFSSYLNPNLPRTLALFSPVSDAPDQASQPLPCFQVNQIEGANLRQTTFCLQGEAYHSVRSVVTPFVRS